MNSLTRQEMDITPFNNILNDMYSRDISEKVLSGITIRSRHGKFRGETTPLSLMRDLEDKGHLIIDPKTAPIIRKIYDYVLDVLGCMSISKNLIKKSQSPMCNPTPSVKKIITIGLVPKSAISCEIPCINLLI